MNWRLQSVSLSLFFLFFTDLFDLGSRQEARRRGGQKGVFSRKGDEYRLFSSVALLRPASVRLRPFASHSPLLLKSLQKSRHLREGPPLREACVYVLAASIIIIITIIYIFLETSTKQHSSGGGAHWHGCASLIPVSFFLSYLSLVLLQPSPPSSVTPPLLSARRRDGDSTDYIRLLFERDSWSGGEPPAELSSLVLVSDSESGARRRRVRSSDSATDESTLSSK